MRKAVLSISGNVYKQQETCMEIDTALSEIESKYDFIFNEKQLTAIKSIIDNKDAFIVLPTGYGKSKIYVHFPEIYELVKTTFKELSSFKSLYLRYNHSWQIKLPNLIS